MLISNKLIDDFAQLVKTNEVRQFKGDLKVGVDLGTANIVVSVVDEQNNPIAGATRNSTVVKDGIVVDYVGAIRILKEIKQELENKLNVKLINAATAIPPRISEGNIKAFANVVEGVGFNVVNIVDEPSAAADVLKIDNGAVVDIGGGTTGISIIKNNEIIFTADEPTGGGHMTLTLAGHNKISIEEAELLKKDKQKEEDIFFIVRPVIQKMASIVKNYLRNYDTNELYLVGGACSFSEFEDVFETELKIKTIKAKEPLFVTPLGVAINCK